MVTFASKTFEYLARTALSRQTKWQQNPTIDDESDPPVEN